ncbi:hypothetical protein F4677DRAFT_413866 [Hypoxylon crocopeplum]|nr:hypothetical protein F4677DRAFT_413866 [Hypoxylon crocopeplum]
MADSVLSPDPRLRQPAHYSRQEVVSALSDFYNFLATLPHIHSSAINHAPPGGWPEITRESLAKRDIHKPAEAIELLRHLPYIRGEVGERFNWIAPECFACDWRLVSRPGLRELRPPLYTTSWLHRNSRGKWQWPEWVVQLAAGRDREEWVLLLDTTDGTVTRYYSMYYVYEPTYPEGDPRSWRDWCCDETLPIREFLDRWRQKYICMEWLGIPNKKLSAIRTGWMPFDEEEGDDSDGEDDDPSPNGKWADDTSDLVRIYREHGWPHNFKRDECRRALLVWKRARPDYVRNIDYD